MTQVVSVLDTSTPTSRILEDSCSSDEHAPHVKFLQILQDLEMTRLSLHLALQVAEGAWGNTTSGGLSLKRKLYPLARKGSMAEIAKARLLGAEIDTRVSITLDAIDLDTSSTIATPRPPRTGRMPKKHRTPNSCRIYGGAPSSTPPKIPRPNQKIWS